jgi:ribosome biogenesis ATPase
LTKLNDKKDIFRYSRPVIRLSDLAGLDSIINQIKELIFFPVLYPELYTHLGVQPSTGLLLQGPSGCGKTTLALAIAGELNIPFFKVSMNQLTFVY